MEMNKPEPKPIHIIWGRSSLLCARYLIIMCLFLLCLILISKTGSLYIMERSSGFDVVAFTIIVYEFLISFPFYLISAVVLLTLLCTVRHRGTRISIIYRIEEEDTAEYEGLHPL